MRHDVPPALAAIVEKCLRKDPAERFASASELASALEPLRRGRASGSSLIGIGSTTRIPAEPARVRGLAVAAVVLVLACGGLFALPQGRSAVRSLIAGHELPDVKQLAVLPFRAAGRDSVNADFVDGLRRHLTFRLSQLEQFDPGFRVIPAEELDRHKVTTLEEALDVSGATLSLSRALSGATVTASA